MVVSAVLIAGVFAIYAWRNLRNASVSPPEPSPVADRTLRYWITVQKVKDDKPFGEPFFLRSEINFEADYTIRLNVESPRPGYLYVVNEGPMNAARELQYVALFPSSTANNGSSFLPPNRSVRIPEDTWLVFDKEQGVEKLWLVFSEHALADLDRTKDFASTRTRGLITDANLNRVINGFLISHAPDQVTVERGEKHTILKTTQNVLVYPIRLEHH